MTRKTSTAIRALAVGLCAVLSVTACGSGGSDSQGPQYEGDSFDWKRYDGTSLKVYVADTGQVESLRAKLPEFQELTGITVEIEGSDVTSYRQNLPVRLTSRASDFDVMATFPEVDGLQFASNGWYTDLTPYLDNPGVTNPEYDFEDFQEGVRNAMTVEDQTVTVLWEMQTDLVYYRKDLLEQAGLPVPTTFAEWDAAAAKVHDPANRQYGFALRGIPYQTTTPFSSFLYAHCGQWVADGKAVINSPEALKAFETYGQLGNKYGPPGIAGFDWPVPSQQFAQGNVFAFLDVNLFVKDLEDPTKSRVAGKVGYTTVPRADCDAAPFIGGWGYSLNPFSEKRDAGWYFIQWATGKQMNLDLKLTGWPSPRASAWESTEFTRSDKTPEFTRTVLTSTQTARAQMNPPVTPGVEAREVAGLVANKALEGQTGATLRSTADQQNARLQELLDAMR
ncbi:sugar ABC transporter substrate-binding protein [Micromonospora sp. WMMD882]|uniref:ABC transporter substrate-binding protein n=1 Tax=Micromonospora sp. WMMD882 TaxID=3015151 RepID=UPI00248D2FA4|nr:sugar ABC transporter substrate-binding protein [Micromonospora sp. WMMD882]WBB81665.1 sugar ABC transporter substrate-binding protein [Micromonospora sp. WMMD882]